MPIPSGQSQAEGANEAPQSEYGHLLRRYRRHARGYDRKYARYSDGTLARALPLVPDDAGRLLDIACGTGQFIGRLREQRPRLHVSGVDISPEMLAKARQRFAGDDQVDFIVGTAERLPMSDAYFDVVACNNAFHLVQDAPAALREFRRVLKPGGRVIIVDWCRDSPQMAAMVWAMRLSDRQKRNLHGVASLSKLLRECGFDVTHAERFRVRPMWGLMAIAATATMPA